MSVSVETKQQFDVDSFRFYEREVSHLGHAIPAELISMISDTAANTLESYLEIHGAPAPVVDLVIQLAALTQCAAYAECGALTDAQAKYLIEEIGEAASNIIALGGTFESPSGLPIRKAEALPWAVK